MESKNLIFLLFFLVVVFFGFLPGQILAELEVSYPVIAGQSLTSSSSVPQYALYIFNGATFLGFFAVFLSLIMAGISFLFSPAKPDLLASAKDRVAGSVSGLLILVLTYLIVTAINPQLSFFNLISPPPPPPPPEEKSPSGVYFYKEASCPAIGGTDADGVPKILDALYNTNDVKDFNVFKNQTHSVGIQQDENGTSYIAIAYDTVDFRGKCLYLDPNESCHSNLEPFASSANIRRFDFSPNGDGVYFYRKADFTKNGGYYKVTNSAIGDDSTGLMYSMELSKTQFTGEGEDCTVPELEQDCIKYEKDGQCAKGARRCPYLSGENISSVWVNGNYLVLFIYFDNKNDASGGPWTYCQAFPTSDDVNKFGPRQIKWDAIRNRGQRIPNYVMIIPVKDK